MNSKELFKKICNFIESEIRKTNGHIIYDKMYNDVLSEFGNAASQFSDIKINRLNIIKLCNIISKQINIPLTITREMVKTRKMKEIFEHADSLGITDEEIYLARNHGYNYQHMCEVFYEMKHEYIDREFFREKYLRYCKANNIKPQINITAPKGIDFLKEILADGKKHSEFFIRLHQKSLTRNRKNRMSVLDSTNNPYKGHEGPSER